MKRDDLSQIFKKFARQNAHMDFKEFKQCIECLAIMYYRKRDKKVVIKPTFWQCPKRIQEKYEANI